MTGVKHILAAALQQQLRIHAPMIIRCRGVIPPKIAEQIVTGMLDHVSAIAGVANEKLSGGTPALILEPEETTHG